MAYYIQILSKVPSRESRDREIPGSRALISRSRVSIFSSRSRDFLLFNKSVQLKQFSKNFLKHSQSDAINCRLYVNRVNRTFVQASFRLKKNVIYCNIRNVITKCRFYFEFSYITSISILCTYVTYQLQFGTANYFFL